MKSAPSVAVEPSRIDRLRALMSAGRLDAMLVTTPTNIRYLTGFTGSNGRVVVTAHNATLVTDARYGERAESELLKDNDGDSVVDIVIGPGTAHSEVRELIGSARKVGIEGEHVTWAEADRLDSLLSSADIVSTSGVVEDLRERKDAAEIASMRAAAAIADSALQAVTAEGIVGLTERQLRRKLDDRALDDGADGASFDTIVASGPLAARPHHDASDRVIAEGELVIIDFGAEVGGYRSDMTRTFISGQASEQQEQMLSAVQQAQSAGLAVAAPGESASSIDAACRSVLADYGLDEFFTHGTGHGVGLDIHEAPSVSARSTATLAPGHVITIEPGVYIPGVGGVRWEDTVLITNDGTSVLTRSPKQPHLRFHS